MLTTNTRIKVAKVLFLVMGSMAWLLVTPVHAFTNTQSVNFASASLQYAARTDIVGTTAGGQIVETAWVKLASSPSSGNTMSIVDVDARATSPFVGYVIDYDNNAGTFAISANRPAQCVADHKASFNTTLTTGTWYFLALEYTSGGTLSIWLNGVQKATLSTSNTGSSCGSSGTEVGGETDGSGGQMNPLDGEVNDVRIFSADIGGTAITDIYTNPCTHVNEGSLAAWYRFQGDYTDSSGNGFTLTAHNTPTFTSNVPYSCATPFVPSTGNFLLWGDW